MNRYPGGPPMPSWPMRIEAVALSLTFLLPQALAQTSATAPPVQLTAAEDHQRLLDLLHITALPPGVSPNAKSPNAVNYDEAKANPWPNLPNPLVLNNGKPVKAAKVWATQRRPQIVELCYRHAPRR